jgi:hypothetical protein
MIIHTNFADGKNTFDRDQISLCSLQWGDMWCVNLHLTNKMMVCVNSNFGHFNDWILLPKESLNQLHAWIYETCCIKFLRLTIVIVAKLNIIVLLDYSVAREN